MPFWVTGLEFQLSPPCCKQPGLQTPWTQLHARRVTVGGGGVQVACAGVCAWPPLLPGVLRILEMIVGITSVQPLACDPQPGVAGLWVFLPWPPKFTSRWSARTVGKAGVLGLFLGELRDPVTGASRCQRV